MSYINPYMLAALAAAAIPVILHLLNLQKVEKIEFSSIMLLKEIRKSRFRKLRIKQFLLMLVRLLAIVFLVLAFADPYIKNIHGKGSDVKRTGLIFVDSSYSMSASRDTANLISEAGKIAGNIEGLFSSSDKIIRVSTSVPAGDSTSAVKTIYRPDLNSLIRTAGLLAPDNPPDEIYVITDLQKVNFSAPPYIKDSRLGETNFYFVDISDANLANVSINNVYNDTKIPNAGGRIKLRVAVKNGGAGFISDARLKVFASGTLKSEQTLELKPYERKEAALEFVQDETGEIPCYAEIEGINRNDDAFAQDNVFKFGLFIPEKIKIGIIKGRTAETKYLASVFDAANSDIKQGIKVYDYSVMTSLPDDLNYDVLFLAGYELKSPDEKNRLMKFVSDGKGVFVFPSNDYNGGLMESIGSVSIGNKSVSGASLKLND
ncbi:MAG: BatA domain-containing protein, partial [Bacteroidetes bacterium]|nr:BatA domain-containing protein [Bacteroidota bacterium]